MILHSDSNYFKLFASNILQDTKCPLCMHGMPREWISASACGSLLFSVVPAMELTIWLTFKLM